MFLRAPSRPVLSRIGFLCLTVLAILAPHPTSALARDLHVPGDFPTIQAALDAAVDGDRVLVDPGTYRERLDFHRRDVAVISTAGAALTELAVPGGTGVVVGPGGAFQGFTVHGAADYFGAGMSVSGIGTIIQANVFVRNMAFPGGFGAAIGGNVASPIVNRNVFRDNSCDDQYIAGVVVFVNDSSPRITNNVFEHNPCRAINMTLPTGTSPLVANNTIVDNPVGIRVDARVETKLHTYRNNIIAWNDIGLQVEFGSEPNNPTWDHNLVFGNGVDYSGIEDQTGKNGNISEPPGFRADSVGDYHLRPSSPAVDAGAIVAGLKEDFDGRPRPVDGNRDGIPEYDMGAFEFRSSARA
jgi:serine protease